MLKILKQLICHIYGHNFIHGHWRHASHTMNARENICIYCGKSINEIRLK